jgi:hypothetical protein
LPGVVAETDLAGPLKSEYVFFDGERVARRDGATCTGGVFYYFSDHLKTASIITDSAGVIKAETDHVHPRSRNGNRTPQNRAPACRTVTVQSLIEHLLNGKGPRNRSDRSD